MIEDAVNPGLLGALSLPLAMGMEGRVLGIPLLTWIAVIAVIAVVLGLVLVAVRKRRRKALVQQLQKQRTAMEKASKDLFSQRKAAEIQEAVLHPGKPTTVVSEGAVAYTETGEMIVFKSSPATGAGDVVASAVGRSAGRGGIEPLPTWSASYKVELVIVLHITGVAMFTVDPTGKVGDARKLDGEILILLERLMERAKWLGGDMVTEVYKDRTVSLTWGEDIHMAAVVDGEPDERLDRELRWTIGDLVEEFSEEIWSWDQETDSSVPRTLTKRIHNVFLLTAGINPGALAAQSQGGGLRVMSTVSWRHSLVEYTLGIVNNGPGPVHEIELLPAMSKKGALDVVTVEGIQVDREMKFHVDDIPQGKKAVATFIFRTMEPTQVRLDCTVVYRRGVASVQQLKVQGRWIELDDVDLRKGDQVEPERAFELAIQPAAFRDRCALFLPKDVDPEKLFNDAQGALREHFDPVVELEDDEMTQLEAWFHAGIAGEGTVIASLTVVPRKGVVDLFAASTVANVIPGTMTLMKKSLDRLVRRHMAEVIDPDLRATVPRMGVLLFQSWGFFEE